MAYRLTSIDKDKEVYLEAKVLYKEVRSMYESMLGTFPVKQGDTESAALWEGAFIDTDHVTFRRCMERFAKLRADGGRFTLPRIFEIENMIKGMGSGKPVKDRTFCSYCQHDGDLPFLKYTPYGQPRLYYTRCFCWADANNQLDYIHQLADQIRKRIDEKRGSITKFPKWCKDETAYAARQREVELQDKVYAWEQPRVEVEVPTREEIMEDVELDSELPF